MLLRISMPLSPLVLLSASATVVLALFCVALLSPAARQRPGNGALLALLIAGALLVARATARGFGWAEPLALTVAALGLFAALPPLAALFARGVLTRQRLGKRDLRHAAAPLTAMFAVGGMVLARGSIETGVWQGFAVALQLVALGYGAWTVRLWRVSERPRWAGGVLLTFGIHWGFSAASWAAALLPGVPSSPAAWTEALSMAALVGFGGAAVVLALRRVPALAPEPLAPYAHTGIAREERQRLAERLQTMMAQDKLYLEPDLSAADLAARIGATPRELSEVLTCEVGESFFEYLAGQRVAEAQRRLSSPEHAGDTILETIYASGFNSKSAFHRAFRERVGQTPSAYRKGAIARPARQAA